MLGSTQKLTSYVRAFVLVTAAIPVLSAQPAATLPVAGTDGWVSMFDGKTLNGWRAGDNPESWKVVNGAIVGDGPRSHLFWMVRECENCEFRAEVKLNHSGNSGMYIRAAFGPGFPKGYEARWRIPRPIPAPAGGSSQCRLSPLAAVARAETAHIARRVCVK